MAEVFGPHLGLDCDFGRLRPRLAGLLHLEDDLLGGLGQVLLERVHFLLELVGLVLPLPHFALGGVDLLDEVEILGHAPLVVPIELRFLHSLLDLMHVGCASNCIFNDLIVFPKTCILSLSILKNSMKQI